MSTLDRRTLLALAASAAALPLTSANAADQATVAITQIVEHPALDACRKGIVDALGDAGWKEGDKLVVLFESAQGQPATAAQIAKSFVGKAPTVIVPISTPSAQAVVSATKEIPVVFTAVTDPVGAGLIPDPTHPGGNVTGLSDLSPLGQHLDLIRTFMPSAKKIGVPYNPGEANAVTLLGLLKDMAPAKGFEIVEAAAAKSADVQEAARSLVGDVDAVYVPTDNTVVSALEALLAVAQQNKLPVFAGDTDSVARGAIATIGFDYYAVGRQTGEIVARVLGGESPGTIPVVSATGTDLVVNAKAAERFGVAVPDDIAKRATRVIEG